MLVSLFDYDLPKERIAQHPASPRDSSRLLAVGETLEDKQFRDLPSLLLPGDLLIFNDSKVIPARLRGRRDDASVEITLFKPVSDKSWRVLAKPAKRLSAGDVIRFGGGFTATVLEKGEDGFLTVRFTVGGESLMKALQHFGLPPLPPYIKRDKSAPQGDDRKTYQTIYARHEGSVAAPTAGLHFTPEMMEALKERGIHTAFVTLHVGGGTFLPVKTEDTDQHIMHAEYGSVPGETAHLMNETKRKGGRIVAVGTTTLRVLESALSLHPPPQGGGPASGARIKESESESSADQPHPLEGEGRGEGALISAWSGETSIFITPGYRFKSADLLLTNFHLPRSTLLMLVSAFAGTQRIKDAYAHAIANNYRFYSYGDACLLQCGESGAIPPS